MARLPPKIAALAGKIPFPLWALRFHIHGLIGNCRYCGGELRVLYGGTQPFLDYFRRTTFSAPPREEFLGSYNIYELNRVRRGASWGFELLRGHRIVANMGLFPNHYFIPEWISGTSDLVEQAGLEATSRSRKRDRRLLQKNEITYDVTTDASDLDFFYDKMYLPNTMQKYQESAVLMTREQMMSRVSEKHGELVSILRKGKPVGGSLIFRENGRPRLYSQGILNGDKSLLRRGVGTAIYLCSLDYLRDSGFAEVHMGWSRPLLAKGSLHFKQRFGYRIESTSPQGHFFAIGRKPVVAKECLENFGTVHYRARKRRAVLFSDGPDEHAGGTYAMQQRQAIAMGLDGIDTIDMSHPEPRSHSSVASSSSHPSRLRKKVSATEN